ncbi:MAG: hypothetical protein AAF401_03045 [Pseudomonadota bacterium]
MRIDKLKLALGLVLLAAGAGAQETAPGVVDTRTDPFSREGVIERAQEEFGDEREFQPAESVPQNLPRLRIEGIGQLDGAPAPAAILNIGNFGTFVVRENDVISLQGLAGDNVIRIKKITNISVTVEAGSFGEIIVVR